jgi:16S rRNA (cytosine967-C5)-methyltransferase
MEEKVAVRIVAKYLKKGNMARCLRDVLPSAGLSNEQRAEIAEVVHDVVRWKKLYEQIMNQRNLLPTPETYIKLAMHGAHADDSRYPFEYRYSCSAYVENVLKNHGDWAEFLNRTPPTCLCVNRNTSSVSTVLDILHSEHLPAQTATLDTAILASSMSKYSGVIRQRFAHIQDENSQFIAWLAVFFGESILDYCAGNGGKSLAMASITQNKKHLTAYEVSAGKRTILRNRCTQYHADVHIEEQPPNVKFDVVLVDAPCTGLGAARRNPEVKYIEGVGTFPTTQLSILEKAASNVQRHGYLLYAVCTITPEETQEVIQTFIRQHGFVPMSWDSAPYTNYLQRAPLGAFTILPQGDLFFVSLLQKS